jgi:hypothetical protein
MSCLFADQFFWTAQRRLASPNVLPLDALPLDLLPIESTYCRFPRGGSGNAASLRGSNTKSKAA